MKTSPQTIVPLFRQRVGEERVRGFRSRRSSALLLVLGMIVLLCALMLAFFASVGTELVTSQTYANGATVKQLADSATQIVISQVVSATGNTNSTLAWASQPGMIRTYDTSGNPALFYKLYSSSSMITNVAAGTFSPASEVPPVDWDSTNNAGIYTDLNSPVSKAGTNYFPIIDPRALAGPTNSVEGFNYTAAVDQVALPAGGTDNQRLPMPVKWLYVLQSGALATPISGSGGTVTFDPSNTTNVPTASNPIVGRIAFWTDDESSKVNINTASEGTFWDRPWVNNTTEQNFATAIPAQNEFQRYPGHPAKTSLSSVFGPLGFPSPWPNPAWYLGIPGTTQTTYNNELAAYYGLTPRIADGGTKGGSVNEVSGSFSGITLDGDRLYASPDELLYDPTRKITTQNGTSMNSTILEKARFFTTAHSRAPEVNLFGKPRMALWPIQMATTLRNAKDSLIAFCSTIGGHPYYFQRLSAYTAPALGAGSPTSSSQSSTLDWTGVTRNQELYTYIDQLTQQKIPGFGGSFKDKYPNTRQQIITEMFDQIRSGVNAYSSALLPKYDYAPTYLDPGEGQVVPLVPPAGTAGAGTHGFGRFATITGASIIFYRCNPSFYTTSPSATSANPVVVDPASVDGADASGRHLNPNGVTITPGAKIGVVLVLNPFTASPGFPPWSPNVQYVITGLDGLTLSSASVATTSLGFPANTPLKETVTSRSEFTGLWNCSPFFGIINNFRYAATQSADATRTPGFSDPVKQYPFAVPTGDSTPVGGVQLSTSDKTFDFNGGTIKVFVYSGSDGSPLTTAVPTTTPIQTITLNFPASKGLHIPTSPPSWSATPVVASGTPFGLFGTPTTPFNNDIGNSTSLGKPWHDWLVYYSPIPTPATNPYSRTYAALGNGKDTSGSTVAYEVECIARGIEADATATPKGDYRLYAGLSAVPSTYFKACDKYDFPVGGPQQYNNVQSLRDQGTDGGGGGGFGFDVNEPFGLYTHYANNPAGVSGARNQVQVQTTATGTLIPQNLLAAYGGTSGNGSNSGDLEYRATAHPAVPNGLQGAFLSNGNYGDWDSMTGLLEDGPYINKPDEGNSSTVSHTTSISNIDVYYNTTHDIAGGYFSFGLNDYAAESGTTFSPNRQISSAVMFGSLPTGIDPTGATTQPWQTLLFCANPASNSSPGATAGASHPGFGTPSSGPPYTTPPDHLLLDLFTMPVVEPYAISEPLSTAGKINMNYQIMPFTYIQRDTGIRAVLKSTRIMAIPQSVSTTTAAGGASYKDGTRCKFEMRYNINPGSETASPPLSDGTLMGFENRFNNGDIFRSASEICGIYLVPSLLPQLSTGTVYPAGSTPPTTYAATSDWWKNFLLTGDNVREFPYGDLYGRLTTKSNTYTVHVQVETLKKIPGTPADKWVEGKDLVTGEYRGSSLIERYVDASDTSLPDFTVAGNSSVEGYYKIRIINSKKFEP